MGHLKEDLTYLSNLIGLIYDGATDPSRWSTLILPAICEYLQMPRALLFTPLHTPQEGGYLFNYGHDSARMELYLNQYQQHNLWNQAGLEQQVFFNGNVVIGDEMVPRQTLLESKFYKEWLAHDSHTGQMLGGIVFGMNATQSMPAVCALMRGINEALISKVERDKMRLILPHISRSLGVMQRIRTAELTVASTLSALHNLSTGVLLLTRNGSVAFSNHAAQRMLEEDDGLSLRQLTQKTGRDELVALDAAAHQLIHQEISAALRRDAVATKHFCRSICVPRISQMGSYSLQFSALGNLVEFGADSNEFAAIVFIADDLNKVELNPQFLQNHFGLTPAEARVAITLLELGTAKEVAQTLGVSSLTVRSQIKQVYLKMGVDTRARFVKLMLGLHSSVG